MRILIVDTYYPGFIDGLPDPINGTYETELRRVLDLCFGTFDAYSHYLKREGWDACDVIANHTRLQRRWTMENNCSYVTAQDCGLDQIDAYAPDVVFMQDLSFFSAETLQELSQKYLLAGQCSCPMPRAVNVAAFDLLFTSFPHYVSKFEALGVEAKYLPLAFDPRMLSEESENKQFDISFVGGVGKRSHWKAGTDFLERIANHFKERFIWFGYGRENLEAGSSLIAAYAGPAWGRAMYSVYGRSKCVVNRHGEVAEGYSNNLRMYEATGMGALLLTEQSSNLRQLFPEDTAQTYWTSDDAIIKAEYFLEHEDERSVIASKSQIHTASFHAYEDRMKIVSQTLTNALDRKKVSA